MRALIEVTCFHKGIWHVRSQLLGEGQEQLECLDMFEDICILKHMTALKAINVAQQNPVGLTAPG